MEAFAKSKYLHSSARKMRQVADLVRGKQVETALEILHGLKTTKKSAGMVDKALKSAVANFQVLAEKNPGRGELTIKSILVDGGPMMKRIRARAQGRAFRIQKQMSHLTVVVSD